MALNRGTNWLMSLTSAAVTEQASGMPLAPVITWSLLRLGPVHRAGACLLAAVGGPHEAAVDQRPGPVDRVGPWPLVEQDLVDLQAGPLELPVPQSPPAGHAASAVQLAREVLPGEAGLE